jgi:hypothetical protein
MSALAASNVAKPKKQERPDLGAVLAAIKAFRNHDCDYYPVVEESGVRISLKTKELMEEAQSASKNWGVIDRDDALERAITRARESLTEVSRQTEYQDQKATRLLTVATFLSAFAGVLFTRFQDSYPLRKLGLDFQSVLIAPTYLLFGAFMLATVFAALTIFHATRTRFKYNAKIAPSYLFFAGMLVRRPRDWMDAWVVDPERRSPSVRDDLQQRYFQNLVSEAYLVAAKTADKLRYLEPAQKLLAWSMKLLIVWLVLDCATMALIDPTKSAKPVEVKMSEPVALPGPQITVQPAQVVVVPAPPAPASPAPKAHGSPKASDQPPR